MAYYNASVSAEQTTSITNVTVFIRNTSEPSGNIIATRTDVVCFLVWMSAMALIGLVGNIIILACYPRTVSHGFHTSTFVQVLAILDLVASIVVVPYSVLFEFYLVRNNVVCKICEFVRHFTITTSLFVLLCIAMERFTIITMATRKLERNHVLILLFVAFAAAAGLSWPALYVYEVIYFNGERVALVTPKTSCNPVMDHPMMKIFSYLILIVFIITTASMVMLYTVMYITVLRYLYQRHLVAPVGVILGEPNKNRCKDFKIFVKPPNPARRDVVNAGRTTLAQRSNQIRMLALPESQTIQTIQIPPDRVHGSPGSRATPSRVLEKAPNRVEASGTGDDPQTIQDTGSSKEQRDSGCDREKQTIAVPAEMASRRSLLQHAMFMSQIRGATMLCGVTGIFLITWIPFWLTKLQVIVYSPILHYLFFFNHSTNVFVYLFYSKHFRNNIRKLCKHRYY